MKTTRIFIAILIIPFVISCASSPKQTTVQTYTWETEKMIAQYPAYRIDGKLQRISIIGSGEGEADITSYLTTRFMRSPNIKVVEPGSLRTILGGKIIEYGTELTPSESQALSQMLQIDHLVSFEERISPYRDYEYGGRSFVRINLKILNVLGGEIIYQTSREFGLIGKDPRNYGYAHNPEMATSVTNAMRKYCLFLISHELDYSLGKSQLGVPYDSNLVVVDVMAYSVADEAGIRKGDRIIEINGKRAVSGGDLTKDLKQGDEVRIKLERQGKVLELNSRIPIIPFKKEEMKQQKPPDKKTPNN